MYQILYKYLNAVYKTVYCLIIIIASCLNIFFQPGFTENTFTQTYKNEKCTYDLLKFKKLIIQQCQKRKIYFYITKITIFYYFHGVTERLEDKNEKLILVKCMKKL